MKKLAVEVTCLLFVFIYSSKHVPLHIPHSLPCASIKQGYGGTRPRSASAARSRSSASCGVACRDSSARTRPGTACAAGATRSTTSSTCCGTCRRG